METLVQFLFRAAFGLSVGLACVSPRKVTMGYFRNHLFVVLGMLTLAALVVMSRTTDWLTSPGFWLPVAGVAVGYLGTMAWMLGRERGGTAALWIVALVALAGAWATRPPDASAGIVRVLQWLDPATSGLLVGLPLASMLLGHWYLNSPRMELASLERQIGRLEIAVILRTLVCGAGLAWTLTHAQPAADYFFPFLALRWLFGILGVAALAGMAWRTLKVPNTQSATGILYVSVIAAFAGELASLLLSDQVGCPV